MSTKFLVFTALLCAVLCISIAVIHLVGVWMLPKSRVLAFNPSGCELPCVLNIVPGTTTESQAEDILAARTSFHNDGDPDFEYQLTGDLPDQPYIGVRYMNPFAPNYVYLLRVTVTSSKGLTTLGQMLAAGYRIHRVIRSSYAGGMEDTCLFLFTFDNNDQIIAIVVAFGNMDLSSVVTDIYVIDRQDHDAFQSIRDQWHGDDEIRWLGFTSVLRYQSEPAFVEK